MTQCNQESFEFQAHFSRDVVAHFDRGTMTSDAGAVLLRETDRRLDLLPRLSACFEDRRQPWLISHTVRELVAQRVYALALGYEDLSDHDQLREDPLLAVLSGKPRPGEETLAGKSTLNRLELGGEQPTRYKRIHYREAAIDELLTKVFLEAHTEAPEQIVLDLDTTDLALHGHQEGRFFHGYYDSYCYLPLYIFSGEHLLCARLRPADQDAAAGSKDEVERIVGQIRAAWPEVEIIVRADSGFCREELLKWCEDHRVGYVVGFARNDKLRRMIEAPMAEAARQHQQTGQPRGGQGRTARGQGESALRGDEPQGGGMAGATVVRGPVLRTRRNGEPHQRATVAVRGTGQRGNAAGQSTPAVLLGDGLCADARAAAAGVERDGTGAGAGHDDPAAAAENRSADSHHRAQGVAVDGLQLSVATPVRAGVPEPAAHGSAASMSPKGGHS
jgi:hypothetical protein